MLGAVGAGSFTVRIPAGQTTATITITPVFNNAVEGLEIVQLSADGSSATVNIADEPAVTFTATDAAASELGGDNGTIVVTRTGANTYDRDVAITIGGTATNTADYMITSPELLGAVGAGASPIRIPTGQTTATITITPIFSSVVEGLETVQLSAEDAAATVNIADEPAVTFTATDADATELGDNTGTIVVTRTGPSTYDRDVAITIGGTATNTSDYTITSPQLLGAGGAGSFTVRIPSGQTTATITITPVFNSAVEGLETVQLSAEGAAAIVNIADEPAVTLAATDAAAAELGADTGTIVVTRTGPSTYDRDVAITIGGTATNTIDYTITSPQVVGGVGAGTLHRSASRPVKPPQRSRSRRSPTAPPRRQKPSA